MSLRPRLRSVLFAPATRPDLAAKLARAAPDAAILDLEDAVPATHKEQARHQAVGLVAELARRHRDLTVFVRVNAVGTAWFDADVEAVLSTSAAGVVVPKVGSLADVARLSAVLSTCDRPLSVVAGIETARGVAEVDSLLTPPVTACYFGAEDFVSDMGGRRTADGLETLYARSRVALAARVAEVDALDQVVVDFRNDAAFRADAAMGRALGYPGKMCLHPGQVALANAVFSPTPEEVDRAARLVAAHEAATRAGVAAIDFEGVMVDEPLVSRAREILRWATSGS